MKWTRNDPASPARLTILQRTELNRLLADNVDPSWFMRFKLFLMVMFGIALVCLPFFELEAFDEWLSDKPVLNLPLLKHIAVSFVVGLVVVLVWEMSVWSERRLIRKMEFYNEHVRFGYHSLLWENVLSWNIVPVHSEKSFSELVMHYNPTQLQKPGDIQIRIPFLARRTKRITHDWSIIIQNPEQVRSVHAEIGALRQSGIRIPELIAGSGTSQISAREQQKADMNIVLVCAIGSWVVLWNGWLVCLFGWSLISTNPSATKHISRHARELNRVLFSIFSSRSELGYAVLIAGSACILIWLSLILYSFYLQFKEKDRLRNLFRWMDLK